MLILLFVPQTPIHPSRAHPDKPSLGSLLLHQQFSTLSMHQNHLQACYHRLLGPSSSVSGTVGLGWSPGMCISNRLPGNAAVPETTLDNHCLIPSPPSQTCPSFLLCASSDLGGRSGQAEVSLPWSPVTWCNLNKFSSGPYAQAKKFTPSDPSRIPLVLTQLTQAHH